jgi:ATP-dependent RNA helicase DeaD
MTHRVDTPVGEVERPSPQAFVDRAFAQPEAQQLPAGDHSVLARRDLGDSPVHREGFGGLTAHMAVKAPRRRSSPRTRVSSLRRRMTFADLGLSESTLQCLTHLGYERPTPIQEQTIPLLLEGRDVIGQAQTGTGKTAAFGLPMIEYVDAGDPDVQALVLTPTRELCIQVTQALRAYGQRSGATVVAVFGGAPIRDQATRLKDAQIVVGTVGRVMDMIGRHHLFLDQARYVVLDEADEMLDLGFLEDVEEILRRAPMGRQTALFSATVPTPIRRLADTFMHDPVEIQVRAATLTIDTVDQYYVEVPDREKPDALVNVLKAERPDQAIVFVRTKIGVDRLARRLGDAGVRVKTLHGDMTQGQRDGVMIAFKGGRERLLVATDVAARGLDITGVSHVVNYDVPNSPDIYVHRIGRTGRAGESGRAITLITPKQRREIDAIERHAKTEIEPWQADNGKPRERQPKLKPRERETRRPRHTKPHSRDGVPYAKLVVSAGRAAGIEPADVVGAVVENTHLENDDVRNVRVLERFSFVEVPAARAQEVAEKVTGNRVRGEQLRLEVTGRR